MQTLEPPPLRARVLAWVPFVASAALVAFGVQLAIEEPLVAGLLGLLAGLVLVPQFVARQRVRRLLISGNVDAVLQAWGGALERVPHPETMAPLLIATAFAANGMVDRARRALDRAERGAAWEAAIEHRLFIETLIEAFDGDRPRAIAKAEWLRQLPLPPAGPFLLGRVVLLRSAAGALARAFAQQSAPGDVEVLERAARRSPLVHWPMRYAAAVAAVSAGNVPRARRLLANAPEWPEESAFHFFDEELRQKLRVDAGARSGVV